jgi:hypothetical protein
MASADGHHALVRTDPAASGHASQGQAAKRRGSDRLKVLVVQWGANTTYATKRATHVEIEEVFGNRPEIRTNLRGRVATHLALGTTTLDAS